MLKTPSSISSLLFLGFSAFPIDATETIIEDTPSRLILEVLVPNYQVIAGVGGEKIVSDLYGSGERSGFPDLPWYRFQIASGKSKPSVTVEPLDWEEISVPKGLAGVPRWLSPKKSEAFLDPNLFAQSTQLFSEISELQNYRGLSLRRISMPLGTFNGLGQARVLKRFRVRVEFSDAMARPNSGADTWLAWAGVKNPKGGAYLTSLPVRKALRKAALRKTSIGASRLKISIGDRQPDGFAEDGWVALTYEAAQEKTSEIIGARIANLRVFTGPKDTLVMGMNDSAPVAPTLREIPIEVKDHGLAGGAPNGTFDRGDTLMFYVQGSSIWKPIKGAPGKIQWEFSLDPYSFYNHYYLDFNGTTPGLRLASSNLLSPVAVVTSSSHYLRAEKEVETGSCDPSSRLDAETGYEWYWHWKGVCSSSDSGVELDYSQLKSPTTDILEGDVGDSVYLGFFTFLDQNREFTIRNAPGSDWMDGPVFSQVSGDWKVASKSNQGKLGISSVKWGGYNHRFDGYTVQYQRALDWKGNPRIVYPVKSGKTTYQVSGGLGARCLKIQEGVGTQWLSVTPIGGDIRFTDSVTQDEDVFYQLLSTPRMILDSNITLEKSASGTIGNLLTGDNVDPEYLIVTPDYLMAEAIELANYRSSSSRETPLKSAVVRTEDIYREWSGGRLSPVAIRDLLRWALLRWGNGGQGKLKYVVLLGDGHYDYRDILNKGSSRNAVPPFNIDTRDESNPMNSDDFYAVLEGSTSWEAGLLSVSIGRIPVQTKEQARAYFDKLKAFEDPKNAGEWRGRITLTADDMTQHTPSGDADPVPYHTNQSENLANVIASREPGMRIEKVYLLDYNHNASWLKPDATSDLLNQINQGTTAITFFGHGAHNQWADEVLLKTNDALSRMQNYGKLFLIAVFSCTVGRFDLLQDEGMTEQFVKQKDFAAIAGIGGSRETYPGPNEELAKAFFNREFPGDQLAQVPTLGQAMQQTKNGLSDGLRNKQKYILFGDPALNLRRTHLKIDITAAPDTLRSLSCGKIEGRISRGSGRGFASIRIVSGEIRKVFLPADGDSSQAQIEMKRGQILFERTVEFKNGLFSADYFLPKQVPFGDSTAKIQIYAWDTEKPLENTLAITKLHIKGSAGVGGCTVQDDKLGPSILVTGCNAKESGSVNFPDQIKISLPYCLQIDVIDSAGVLSGDGPDEGTTVELAGVREPFHPQAGLDELYRKSYQLNLKRAEAAPGEYLLKVTARDGFGNLGLRQIKVQVNQDSILRFVRTFNAPNPVKRNGTTFYFSTTLPQDEGEVLTASRIARVKFDLRIFNQLGHLVRVFANAQSGSLRWDGSDAWGQPLANGVYFYSVTANWETNQGSPGLGQSTSLRNTLVLSR